MSEWKTEKLGLIANIRRGISYSEATLEESQEDGNPYLNMKSFLKDGGYNTKGLKFFSGHFTKSDTTTTEDLLIANTDVTPGGDIIGVPALLPMSLATEKVLFSHHVTRLQLSDQVETQFLYYLLCTDSYRRSMRKYARGTTVLMLDMTGIKRIPVQFPKDRGLQKKVSSILSTIDTAIEQTEALIEKYQHIKAGLMHDLFTRGVLPNGHLRPPREQAPELYQETAIGWIPREWKSGNLASIANLIVGYAFKSEWFVADGINLLRGENVGYGAPDWQDRQCLNPGKRDSFAEYLLNPGDVVIGMDRTFTKSGVKITQLAATDCPALLVQRVGKFVAINCDADYLRWLVVSSGYLRSLFNQQKGMDIPHLSKSEILAPVVPRPNRNEQRLIASQVQGIAELIEVADAQRQKLTQQKLGLMQDLLTGKVMVTVDDQHKEHA